MFFFIHKPLPLHTFQVSNTERNRQKVPLCQCSNNWASERDKMKGEELLSLSLAINNTEADIHFFQWRIPPPMYISASGQEKKKRNNEERGNNQKCAKEQR